MEVWIVNPYGNIPGEGWREYRSTMLAEALAKRGHTVVWWVANFEHRSKKFRSEGWKDIVVNPHFLIRIVPSTEYRNHISIARIKYERQFVKNFREAALKSSDKPDIIIAAEPALFISDVIIDVVKAKKCKLVIDIIDLWPELFNIMLPKSMSFLGRGIFSPLYSRRSWFLKKADALIAVSRDYLKVGLQVNNTKLHDVIYWGVDVNSIMNFEPDQGEKFKKEPGEFWVIYAGTFGSNYDLRTILQCSKKIEQSKHNIKIILAGDGALKSYVENFISSNNLKKTKYIGRVSAEALNLLYQLCDVGLSSYVKGSTVSMPIKAYDYLAAGLPLVNSIERDLMSYIEEYRVGIQYEAENADAMFASIIKVYQDPILLKTLKENTIIAAKIFDKNIQYDKIIRVCEEVINEPIKYINV